MIKNGDVIEAWTLVFRVRPGNWRTEHVKAYFYVPPEFRRDGLGKMMASRIKKDFGRHNIKIEKWDARSDCFFSSQGWY